MILTNCTDTRRGISLRDGVHFLEGREIWTVPLEKRDEIRAMFNSKTFQRFTDNGIFRLAEMRDDEESARVATPEPPQDLEAEVPVEAIATPVSTRRGSRARALKVVEHQNGGPLGAEATA